MIYTITYQLKNLNGDYSHFYESIKKCGEWKHPLENLWLVKTDKSAKDIYEIIKPNLEDEDLLFIAEMNKSNYSAWIASSIHTWIELF